jgi:hypothetical protein
VLLKGYSARLKIAWIRHQLFNQAVLLQLLGVSGFSLPAIVSLLVHRETADTWGNKKIIVPLKGCSVKRMQSPTIPEQNSEHADA